ncbi:MAG: hypothetical protein H7Y62_08215, partial [Hyphomicrobium sp.]|nr:hypothetical protein [Hyphomicrobium sp.]
MIFLLMMIATPTPAVLEPNDGQTIVVTARTLKDTERDLVECIAKRCSPKEDIEASLAHGENLFLAGQFAEARTTLGRARNRNLRYAKELPIEV